MKSTLLWTACAVLMMTGTSCEGLNPGRDRENAYQPMTLTTRSAEFIEKGNTFSFDLLERVNAVTEEDYIISPLSLQFLLGMILDGARNETAAEICQVLGYGSGEMDAVHAHNLSLLEQLPGLDKQTTLNIANAIFVDDGWPLLDSYKAEVGKYYQATVSNLDFSQGAYSLKVINGWCSKQTAGMIPKVLDEVSEDMLAYLLNALYFKSQWRAKFPKSATADQRFTTESGAAAEVKMMRQVHDYPYTETERFQAVRLPYGNGAFSMVVLLPKAGAEAADIAADLHQNGAGFLRSDMYTCEVDLWLPKFETKFKIKLNDLLSEMGMPHSFDGVQADFKAMSDYALCLSFVQQDAIIKVDEEGTEAAAVSSAGMMKATAVGPERRVVFHADHPFLYLITESATGAVLFAGRYGGGQ
ncbi:MAG: serpin family protein [Bacteroidales bacterium]|nr:serpin family protein [Bacteroidales bacterium]